MGPSEVVVYLDGFYDPATGLPDALGAVAQALVDAREDRKRVRITITEVW